MGQFDKGLFEHKLTVDTELAEAFSLRKLAIQIIKQQRELELRDYLRKNAPRDKKLGMWQSIFIYSAAASVILLAVSWAMVEFYFPKPELAYHYLKKEKPKMETESAKVKEQTMNDPASANGLPATPPQTGVTSNQLSESDMTEDELLAKQEMEITRPTAPENQQTPALTQSDVMEYGKAADEFKVQEDYLLLDTTFTALVLEDLAMMDAEQKPASANGYTAKKKDTKISSPEKTQSYKKSDVMKPLQVEIWKSPINYRGYRYNGKKVQLFGVAQPNKAKFKYYKENLYLVINEQVFLLAKEDHYNSYWPETDKRTIQIMLNE